MDANFTPLGEKVAVMRARHDIHGWERHGENNSNPTAHPYIEGVFVNKVNGKYYLQYAAPGTEFNVYANGVYVADAPLGPFTYQVHNPFSSRPGGFATGAGHGSTFQDFAGNWWHIATIRISVNEMFERRLGLFPCDFDADGVKFCNQHFADYPYALPDGKRSDMQRIAPMWNLLSYNKPTTASSHQLNHAPALAANEDITTWWAADANDSTPWLQIDLRDTCAVHALQINFADHQTPLPHAWDTHADAQAHGRVIYSDRGDVSFLLQGSTDGEHWTTIKDTRNAPEDNPHDLIVLDTPTRLRYVRISYISQAVQGTIALSGLRIFGMGNGTPPAPITSFTAKRSACGMDASLTWEAATNADGYNLRYGTTPDKLYNSWQVFGKNALKFTFLTKDKPCYLAIDSFNENGVTPGTTQKID